MSYSNQQMNDLPTEFSLIDGIIQPAQQLYSKNYDARPCAEISLLVIHNISLPPGEYGSNFIEDLFCNRLNPKAHPFFKSIAHLKVSAHLLIRRSGQVQQFVPLTMRAWHAGQSMFQGRPQCNDFSIGIELEGSDYEPFEPIQYQQLIRITQAIMQQYPAITADRITGHADIAPGRKSDPGPFFAWRDYLQGLSSSARCET